MKKIILFVLTIILLACNAYKDIPVQNLTIGMSVSEVQAIVEKQMVQVSMSSDNEGEKQVYQVQKRIVRGGIARQQRYNLFFLNGKLVKYEKDSENFSL
jgi:DNA-dependent RNA polymerase auxiliary subunit epsilon